MSTMDLQNASTNTIPSLRLCYVRGSPDCQLGLHLSRTPCDPYPWISAVIAGSKAHLAGLRTGDCILEVNGEDVLGQKIIEVAEKVRSSWKKSDNQTEEGECGVSLLLWNSGSDQNNLNSQSLSRFANCLQNVAQLLECPVCLEIVKPPAWQCCHGHVLCGGCRSRSTKCPVCRVVLGQRGRCLIADKLFAFLADTFNNPEITSSNGVTAVDSKYTTCSSKLIPVNSRNLCKQYRKLMLTNLGGCNLKNSKVHGSSREILCNEKSTKEKYYHCLTGQSCDLMKNQHELLMHLQKTHQLPVIQYYSALGDFVKIKFSEKSIISIVLTTQNSELHYFYVVKFPNFDSFMTAVCWVWYLGEKAPEKFNIKIQFNRDCKNSEWHGKPNSLASSFEDVIQSKNYTSINLATDYLNILIK